MQYYKGYLKGDYLTDAEAERLLKIQAMQDKGMYFKDLKNIIYDLSPDKVEEIKKKGEVPEGMELTRGELTDLQTTGVAYMYFAKRLMLSDSVGFGKTAQACGLIRMLQEQNREDRPIRFAYFSKKTLASKDQDEIIRFTGDYVHILKGESACLKKELPKLDTAKLPYSVVCVHSVIKNPLFIDWFNLYCKEHGRPPFDVIFIDESSSVCTAKPSQFTKPSQMICDATDRVILMNATPFETRLESFRVQMALVDPTLLPKKTVFQKIYQKTRDNGRYIEYIDEYKNEAMFKDSIKLRFLSRKRKETGGRMTNCEAKLIIVQKSKEQKRIEKLTSLPQLVYDCPSAIDRDVTMNTETCPKLQAVLNLMQTEGQKHKTVMIYCRYKESQQGIIDTLERAGYACEKLNGETKAAERKRITESFQKGEFKVLVTNVQEGLNFGGCNMTIFYSALPNPNKMVQVEGRMTRDFDIKDKRVFLLATQGRELSTLKDTIANRAKSSDQFAGSDYSLILDLLKNNIKK